MMDYLRELPLELPTPVTAARPLAEGEGSVTSNLGSGELFLIDEEGQAFRVSWLPGADAGLQPRPLPAGVYTLRTYRIGREREGESWHVSATAPKIQKIEVAAGENRLIKVHQAVTITSEVQGRTGVMNILGAPRVGLSIYRNGKRIPIDYRLLDSSGKLIASGAMRYG